MVETGTKFFIFIGIKLFYQISQKKLINNMIFVSKYLLL
jgi:hypothetical protein